ncbi:MAG: NUDIX hydrolase [Bacteroidota bacterium]
MADRPRNLTETRLDREELVDGYLLHAYRDRVLLPDGNTSVREWIDHPGASAVIPVLPDGDTLLVRQFRYPPHRTFLELPAGKLDFPEEDPADVARRELKEETGWTAETVISLGPLYPCIGYSNEVIHYFIAEGLTAGEQALSEAEFIEVVRMPLRDAVAMVYRGDVLDMKTAIGLLWAARYVADNS